MTKCSNALAMDNCICRPAHSGEAAAPKPNSVLATCPPSTCCSLTILNRSPHFKTGHACLLCSGKRGRRLFKVSTKVSKCPPKCQRHLIPQVSSQRACRSHRRTSQRRFAFIELRPTPAVQFQAALLSFHTPLTCGSVQHLFPS